MLYIVFELPKVELNRFFSADICLFVCCAALKIHQFVSRTAETDPHADSIRFWPVGKLIKKLKTKIAILANASESLSSNTK